MTEQGRERERKRAFVGAGVPATTKYKKTTFFTIFIVKIMVTEDLEDLEMSQIR